MASVGCPCHSCSARPSREKQMLQLYCFLGKRFIVYFSDVGGKPYDFPLSLLKRIIPTTWAAGDRPHSVSSSPVLQGDEAFLAACFPRANCEQLLAKWLKFLPTYGQQFLLCLAPARLADYAQEQQKSKRPFTHLHSSHFPWPLK